MSRTRWLLLGSIALLVLAAAGGLAQGEAEVSDPADDGRVWTSEAATNSVCQSDCPEDRGSHGGVPAPDALEATSVHLQETPTHLLVELQLVAIDEDYDDVASEDGGQGTRYVVCWDATSERCHGYAYLIVERIDGRLVTSSGFGAWGPGCPDNVPCQYDVDVEVHTGAPGTIEWRIPRALMPNGTEGDTVSNAYGTVHRVEDHGPGKARVDLPGGGFAGPFYSLGDETGEWSYYVDHLGSETDFAFELDAGPLPARSQRAHFNDPALDVESDRLDLDVREVRVQPDDEDLTIAIRKALVREEPDRHRLFANFGISDSMPLIYSGTSVYEGQRQAYAAACSEVPCQDGSDLAVDVETDPGRPGWVNLTLEGVAEALDGRRLAWMWAGASDYTDHHEPGLGEVPRVTGAGLATFEWDVVGPGPAYRIGDATPTSDPNPSAPSREVSSALVTITDAPDDADLPAATALFATARESDSAQASPESSYEITEVRGEAISGDTVRTTMTIDQLRKVDVPDDWDAVLYATALETPDGAFLAGYYLEEGTADEREEWFCTRDTTVLAPDPGDPNAAAWIPIDGVLQPSPGDTREGEGGNDTAQLRFTVPRECLAEAPNGEIDISAMGAGTYLIRNPDTRQAQVEPVDQARLDANRTLEPESPQPAEAASVGGFTQPFGVENFWDIAGITFTALASLVGAVLVRRRRGSLQGYLEEIEQINAEYEDDPSGRQTALRELQADAKSDLVDGRLTENQYVVVKDRVADEMSEARLDGLEETFPGLPHRLLRKLKTMVANEGLSSEDRRMFSAMLEDSGLNDAAKERVRRKLSIWAEGEA